MVDRRKAEISRASVAPATAESSDSGKLLGSNGLEAELVFESILADLSARFVHVSADRVDAEIEGAQREVCEFLGLDLSALWQLEAGGDALVMTHLYRPLGGPPVPERMEASEHFPWSLLQVLAGRVFKVSTMEDVPAEAAHDLEMWRHYGIRTVLCIPLAAGRVDPFGAVSFHDMRRERIWSDRLVSRLNLVAQVFANALLRKRAERDLRESEERLSLAADAANAGMWSLNLSTDTYWLTPRTRDLFGFEPDEVVTRERFLDTVHLDDREAVEETMREVVRSGEVGSAEYRIVKTDGTSRWIASRGRVQSCPGGAPDCLMGVSVDVTARKLAENDLRRALAEVRDLHDRLERENVYLQEQMRSEAGHGTIVGESEPVQRMLALARKVASTEATVLVHGATGTGKQLLAQAIHDLSPRGGRPMVQVNCASLPGALIEGELFGREKGAYTGAMTRRVGRFEVADGSTLFLDEIGDLPLELQGKLLRVLQDGRFERLGSNLTIETHARVIAATNHDLGAKVEEGTFREDLYHRLNVFPIEVPPLRARREDIPLLIWRFVQDLNAKMGRSVDTIPRDCVERLQAYDWPGNVRELRNAIERAMILSEDRSLRIEVPARGPGGDGAPSTLEEVERRHIEDVLDRTQWRISGKGGAAEILDLVPTTLRSRMKKLGISRPDR